MSLIRIILVALVVYLVFRILRSIFNSLLPNTDGENRKQKFGGGNKKKQSSINKKDIIEAEFEEIKEDKDKAKD